MAQYMATSGLEERAMKVFRQAAIIDPSRPEPYVLGLRLANRLESIDDIEWACLGILSQVWPTSERPIEESAYRTALATIEKLTNDGKVDEAARFRSRVEQALIRDCKVVVSWTGDADVDLLSKSRAARSVPIAIRAPPPAACCWETAPCPGSKLPAQGSSETYVCPRRSAASIGSWSAACGVR